MLEYKRECERIAAKAETLERDSRENMHRLVATEECWSQVGALTCARLWLQPG